MPTYLTDTLGEVADMMRTLQANLGMRKYRVFSILSQWSGGELYVGKESIAEEIEFTPTPFIDLRTLYTAMTEAGQQEEGEIVLKEISYGFTEEQVRALCLMDRELQPGQQTYIEVRHTDPEARRRRFTVRGVPWQDADTLEWIVSLSVEEEPRELSGAPATTTLNPIQTFRPA